MTGLLVALLVAAQAAWRCAPAHAQGIDGPPYRFEGFIRGKSPDLWVIGSDLDGYKPVAVSPQSVIISKTGHAAEVGAWVVVFARRVAGQFQASLIQVERPAGAPGLSMQFTGTVSKQGEGWWRIGDMPVAITDETELPDVVPVGATARVGATVIENGLRAEWIRVLPDQQVVEFEGAVQAIKSDSWVIDGHVVQVTDRTEIVGEQRTGMFAECRALKHDDGTLVALDLQVSAPSAPTSTAGAIIEIGAGTAGAATWSVLLEQTDPGGHPRLARVHVDGNTWVDQSRAVAGPGQWFRLRGVATGADAFQADLLRIEHGPQAVGAAVADPTGATPSAVAASPWGAPATVAGDLDNAEHAAMAFTRDGAAHAIWETNNRLYAAHQGLNGSWSLQEEVAYGFAPHMLADANGHLHVAFVNSFMGNFETYYVTWREGQWTLPVNMSHTDGYSAHPRLALAPDGGLHATWMDYTPGYWTSYYATWSEPFWSTRPIPSGRGEAPAISVDQDGVVYTVWQDRFSPDGRALGDYEVFLAELRDGVWSPPLNISDSRDINTLGPDIITTSDGTAHVVWIDGDELIRYSYGQGSSWSAPTTVAAAIYYANGAHIAAESDKALHIAWDEEDMVRAASAPPRTTKWPEPQPVANTSDLVRDVCLAPNPSGGVGLSWLQTSDSGKTSFLASQREPVRAQFIYIPLAWQP
jgi:hypothetical protein